MPTLRPILSLVLVPLVLIAHAAPTTPAGIWRAQLETDLGEGLPSAALARELQIYFPSPADREFLAKQLPAADRTLVKPRAFERTGDGYRVTTPNGRLVTVTTGDDGTVFLNTAPMPDFTAGLRPLYEATTKALARPRVAARKFKWFALNHAHAAPVDMTNAFVMMTVFMVVVMQKSPGKAARAPRLTDLINHGAEVCELENFQKVPFDESRTGKMLARLQSYSALDFASESTADSCRVRIKDVLEKRKGAAKSMGVSEVDLLASCDGAARLTTCVREYRRRKTDRADAFTPAASDSAR